MSFEQNNRWNIRNTSSCCERTQCGGKTKGILVLAYSSAKKFGANKYVAVVVAGVSMYPVLNTVLESGQTVHFLGIPLLR